MRGVSSFHWIFCWRRFAVVLMALVIIIILVETQKILLSLENQVKKVPSITTLNSSERNTWHLPATDDIDITQESTTSKHISLGISSSSDKPPFRYLINEPKFCNSTENLYIINIVATAPWETLARSRIRRLWGNKMWLNMTGFRTVFLLGEATDLQLMDDIKEESNKYRDMIQFSFLDTYDNLTLKILSGLHWIHTFCPTPAWVLKSDSDVLVNIFELSSFLHKYDEVNHQRRNNFLCKRHGPVKPCRTGCKKKWQVSLKEYPYDMYPRYCFGPGYIIPRRLVATLYQAANKTHPFRMEDVYYTGLIPVQLGWEKVWESIAHRFPWRPTAWKKSFITTDLMILEFEKRIGRGAFTLIWTNILKHRGLLPNGGKGTNVTDKVEMLKTQVVVF